MEKSLTFGGRKFICSFPTFHKKYPVLHFDYFYAMLWLSWTLVLRQKSYASVRLKCRHSGENCWVELIPRHPDKSGTYRTSMHAHTHTHLHTPSHTAWGGRGERTLGPGWERREGDGEGAWKGGGVGENARHRWAQTRSVMNCFMEQSCYFKVRWFRAQVGTDPERYWWTSLWNRDDTKVRWFRA